MVNPACRHRAAIALWTGAAVLCPATALAQSAIKLPPQGDISRQRVAPLPLPPADYEFRIENPEKSAVARSVDDVKFSVKSIRVIGATRFPEAQVKAFFTPVEGRVIVLDDLRKAAQDLEDLYRKNGYFLTRVFIAPQQVKDGVLEVQVLEGYVGAVFVEGPNAGSRHHAEALLKPVMAKRPTNFDDLEERLLLINDTPGLAAKAVLRQGAERGSSELLLTATRLPTSYRASFSNSASEILGPTTYGVGATFGQPLGRPGSLDIDLSGAGGGLKELRSANLRYAMPLAQRAIFSVGGLLAYARPGGFVANLNIKSRVMTLNTHLRVPLVRSRDNSLYFDGGLTVNRSRTFAIGKLQVDDRGTVADAGLSWQTSEYLNGTTTVTVALFRGVDLFGANDRSALFPSVQGFKPDFLKVGYSLQRTQALVGRLSAQFNLQGQYSNDRLPSGELISFGGPSLGRGYDPSLVAGERGVGMLLELRYGLPVHLGKVTDGVTLYGFGDWGRATSLAKTPSPKTTDKISSAGFGVRSILWSRVSIDAQGAFASRSLGGRASRSPRFNLSLNLFL